MFSVSAEVYEVLSLAMRYVFSLLGVVIVLRAFLSLLSERQARHNRLHSLPDAGMIGELVVLTGSRELPENSYLPVPREGVLGSVRSCDLVVPYKGVRRTHLDFLWEDAGLVVRPRRGCEAVVDGVTVSGRGKSREAMMHHGSFLQAGSCLLRLRLFAGLDASAGFEQEDAGVNPPPAAAGTPAPSESFVPPEYGFTGTAAFPETTVFPRPAGSPEPAAFPGSAASPEAAADPPGTPVFPEALVAPPEGQAETAADTTAAPELRPADISAYLPPNRRRRAASWKEDWSD